MPEPCGRTFDESRLTGYVDRALPQVDEQQVRVHLEDCPSCRAIVSEMIALRGVAMSSAFKVPEDRQWSEAPRSGASRLSLGLGWLLVIAWCAVMVALAAVETWRASPSIVEKLLAFGGVSGVVLLFVGVLLDRLRVLKTDRYREVRK